MPGWAVSHAAAVAISWSGRSLTMRRRSRSQTIVPQRWLRLKAQSSTPTTVRGAVRECARRRTACSSVSLLTGTISRAAKAAPGLPPRRDRGDGRFPPFVRCGASARVPPFRSARRRSVADNRTRHIGSASSPTEAGRHGHPVEDPPHADGSGCEPAARGERRTGTLPMTLAPRP